MITNETWHQERASSHPRPGDDRPTPTTGVPSAAGGGGDGGGRLPRRPGAGRSGRPDLGWTELVVAFVLFVVLGFTTAFGWVVVSAVEGPQGLPLMLLLGLAAVVSALLALTLRVRGLGALGFRSTSAVWLGAAVLLGVVTRLVTLGGTAGIGELIGAVGDPWASLGLPVDDAPTPATLLVAGVLLPAAVEVLFRGIGYGALRRYGVWVAATASSLVFGLAHGFDAGAVSAVVLGVVTALLYERSRSLWPAMVAAAAFSLAGFAIAAFL